jgi:hypothetical protein
VGEGGEGGEGVGARPLVIAWFMTAPESEPFIPIRLILFHFVKLVGPSAHDILEVKLFVHY